MKDPFGYYWGLDNPQEWKPGLEKWTHFHRCICTDHHNIKIHIPPQSGPSADDVWHLCSLESFYSNMAYASILEFLSTHAVTLTVTVIFDI